MQRVAAPLRVWVRTCGEGVEGGKKVTGVGIVLTVTVTTAVTFGMRVYVRAFGIGLVVCLAMYSADPCIHDTGGCWLDRPCPMTYS